MMNKGQISVFTAIIGAVGMITASAFTSWATVNTRIARIEVASAVVSEREELHYKELKESVGEMKSDIKIILKLLNENGTQR